EAGRPVEVLRIELVRRKRDVATVEEYDARDREAEEVEVRRDAELRAELEEARTADRHVRKRIERRAHERRELARGEPAHARGTASEVSLRRRHVTGDRTEPAARCQDVFLAERQEPADLRRELE